MYNKNMNKTQLKLIELSVRKNIWDMSLREIGKEIDVKNAATVKYHLDQLKNKNLLKRPANMPSLMQFKSDLIKSWEALVNIPVLGAANCGIPLSIANESLEGYLKISPRLLPDSNQDHFFALKAEGESMNRANINGQNIEDGDYVIIDSNKTDAQNIRYALSIIDGCANIKRLILDKDNERIALVSESTQKYNPIYIHKDDDFLINGSVVSVIKNPVIAIE